MRSARDKSLPCHRYIHPVDSLTNLYIRSFADQSLTGKVTEERDYFRRTIPTNVASGTVSGPGGRQGQASGPGLGSGVLAQGPPMSLLTPVAKLSKPKPTNTSSSSSSSISTTPFGHTSTTGTTTASTTTTGFTSTVGGRSIGNITATGVGASPGIGAVATMTSANFNTRHTTGNTQQSSSPSSTTDTGKTIDNDGDNTSHIFWKSEKHSHTHFHSYPLTHTPSQILSITSPLAHTSSRTLWHTHSLTYRHTPSPSLLSGASAGVNQRWIAFDSTDPEFDDDSDPDADLDL